MYRCIIQYHKSVFTNLKGEGIKKFDNFLRSNTVGCGKTFVIILAVNHPKYIEPCSSSWCNVYILIRKLPTVGNIPFGANVAFVSIIQVNLPKKDLFLSEEQHDNAYENNDSFHYKTHSPTLHTVLALILISLFFPGLSYYTGNIDLMQRSSVFDIN